jgi:hypothetical protein
MEVKRLDHLPESAKHAVKKIDHVDLEAAKARVGAAVESAIGNLPLKAFGDAGLISKVATGEKAPEYLARIYQDKAARRRFAVAWLADDEAVKVRTVIEIDEEVA